MLTFVPSPWNLNTDNTAESTTKRQGDKPWLRIPEAEATLLTSIGSIPIPVQKGYRMPYLNSATDGRK